MKNIINLNRRCVQAAFPRRAQFLAAAAIYFSLQPMSLRAMIWAFDQEVYSSSQKFVLVALANFANEYGHSYPSVGTICAMTALNDKTVRKAMEELAEEGFIQDTGKRYGQTQQVRIWILPEGARDEATQKRVSLKKTKTPKRPQEDSRKTVGRLPNLGSDPINIDPLTKEQDSTASPQPVSEPPEPSPFRSQKTDHTRLIDGWTERYERRGIGKYQFCGGRDGKAAKELLKVASVDEILSVLDSALAKTDEKKFWNCVHQTATLGRFGAAYNAIRAELASESKTKINPSFDADEWVRRINESSDREIAEQLEQERLAQGGLEQEHIAQPEQQEVVYEIE